MQEIQYIQIVGKFAHTEQFVDRGVLTMTVRLVRKFLDRGLLEKIFLFL